MSLKARAIQGIFWTFGQQFVTQIIQFIVQIILARVLMPEEFGVIGVLAVFMALGNSLVDSGMSSSLIRTQDVEDRDFSSVFVINITVSVFVYLILFFTSQLIANFFNQPILSDIVKVYCLSFIIRAISSIQYIRLTILMDFKTQTTLRLPALAISSAVGLVLAYRGYGVWSLVYMHLANVTLESILIWFQVKWRPSFILDWNRLKCHFNFGYKLTLSGIIDTLYSNIYYIIIGKYFSIAQLGFYIRAQSLRQLPVSNISSALNQVTYPLFSSIQNDNVRLKNVYKRLMQQVLYWIAPILVIAGVLGEPLFRFLMTEKWLPAVPYFQILCLGGIMYPLHAYNLNILNVKGRSDLFLKLEIVKKALITIGFLIAIPFGIYGLLWMQFVLTILAFFINTYFSGIMINYSMLEQVKDVLPILGLAGIIGILVFLVDLQFPISSNFDFIRLVAGTVLGLGSYITISFITQFDPFVDFRELILKR
jgi:O-antigen/teichoic acid export membrane protein